MYQKKRRLSEKGFALVATLVLTAGVLTVASGLLVLGNATVNRSVFEQAQTQALYSAESGVNEAIALLRKDGDSLIFRTPEASPTLPTLTGTDKPAPGLGYRVWVYEDEKGFIRIYSEGWAGVGGGKRAAARRRLAVTIGKTSPFSAPEGVKNSSLSVTFPDFACDTQGSGKNKKEKKDNAGNHYGWYKQKQNTTGWSFVCYTKDGDDKDKHGNHYGWAHHVDKHDNHGGKKDSWSVADLPSTLDRDIHQVSESLSISNVITMQLDASTGASAQALHINGDLELTQTGRILVKTVGPVVIRINGDLILDDLSQIEVWPASTVELWVWGDVKIGDNFGSAGGKVLDSGDRTAEPSTWPRIYVKNAFSMYNASRIGGDNNRPFLLLASTETSDQGDIVINSGSWYFGGIYAPTREITINGLLKGSAVGAKLTGSEHITYDSILRKVTLVEGESELAVQPGTWGSGK